ncbi:MAG: peptidase M42, partial [Pseudopedobacter saltans]
MPKQKKKNTSKDIITENSFSFLKEYINNPSPTGFESSGQQMWLDYIRPYIDDYIVDPYGSVAA